MDAASVSERGARGRDGLAREPGESSRHRGRPARLMPYNAAMHDHHMRVPVLRSTTVEGATKMRTADWANGCHRTDHMAIRALWKTQYDERITGGAMVFGGIASRARIWLGLSVLLATSCVGQPMELKRDEINHLTVQT